MTPRSLLFLYSLKYNVELYIKIFLNSNRNYNNEWQTIKLNFTAANFVTISLHLANFATSRDSNLEDEI